MDVKQFFKKVDEDKLDKAAVSDSPEDMRHVGEEAGMELSDEQLDYVAGGWFTGGYDSEAEDFADSYL